MVAKKLSQVLAVEKTVKAKREEGKDSRRDCEGEVTKKDPVGSTIKGTTKTWMREYSGETKEK